MGPSTKARARWVFELSVLGRAPPRQRTKAQPLGSVSRPNMVAPGHVLTTGGSDADANSHTKVELSAFPGEQPRKG